jgi:competence protein ComEA
MDALIDRYRTHIIAGLIAIVAALAVWAVLEQRDGSGPIELVTDNATPGASGSGRPITVYITGAVNEPGVYELDDGDRAIDALDAAGGAAPDANLEAVNLALRLHDEDQLTVPRLGDATSGVAGVTAGASSASGGGPTINLNSATAAELEALPGIGETYAARIVDSRTTAGPFTTPEDLLTRDLIPQGTYERIASLIEAP